ncbi:MmgE/PrpD family protein [Amycolatopsis sp. K13G38]|uniref:MmgE/PrpD family protein n=1 Tax=Amycolatopsis acididurans TaxID=2724524 RepID=A0ABX1J703_9PSEU|nr:MmgE/PrpD family protein [Amycolatopsis acididurans]NKQ55523.1 MmgE/PrpD family protein [Amycolatopsis acididurans]
MPDTLAEQLARFTATTETGSLPGTVVEESKRLVLDSIGCALAGTGEPRGRIGVDYGRMIGGTDGEATILGTGSRSSVFGAAFANGELMNALDFDAVLPPGHVSPYVLPGALAFGESRGISGSDLIAAVALSHEMSYRFGKAMDYLRDTKNGEVALSPILGFSSTVFGATAAIGKVKGYDAGMLANALAIAANISPVNSHRSWLAHSPSSTIKYLNAGVLVQSALTAAHFAELGHRGDLQVLDDADYGYRRFIGTGRWVPEQITDGLGTEWRFPAESTLKPYPHCRILHAPLDALTEIVETNDIKPDEIDAIRAWGEAWVLHPVWLNREISHVHDAQFSIAHGLAVGAHRVTPGKAWQDPDLVFGSSVRELMDKTTFKPHPDWGTEIEKHPSSRPTRIEVDARGTTFSAERRFPKGSPSPDPSTLLTTDELVAKFRVNAEDVIPESEVEGVLDSLLDLEKVGDIRQLLRALGGREHP